jgi:hypothetical protein
MSVYTTSNVESRVYSFPQPTVDVWVYALPPLTGCGVDVRVCGGCLSRSTDLRTGPCMHCIQIIGPQIRAQRPNC